MQEIFNFISVYWKEILSGVLCVVSVIIALLRKRPINDIYSKLYSWCIAAVNLAEQSGYKGTDKLTYALGIVYKFFVADYPSVNVTSYEVAIKAIIERILSTPQKK